MRITSLSLSVAAMISLAVPGAGAQQVVVRDPCFYARENCDRRVDLDRRTRERIAERLAEAEERKWRLNDASRPRELERHLRAADAPNTRSIADRSFEITLRARELQDRLRDQQFDREHDLRARTLERTRELRERDLERARDLRERELERAQEMRERAQEMRERTLERTREMRERTLERAQRQREDAERRRELNLRGAPRVRWQG